MKKILFLLLFPSMLFAQYGHEILSFKSDAYGGLIYPTDKNRSFGIGLNIDQSHATNNAIFVGKQSATPGDGSYFLSRSDAIEAWDFRLLATLEFVIDANKGGWSEIARFDRDANFGLGATSFGTSAAKAFAIGVGTAPTTSPANEIQLYAKDSVGVAQLYVLDEGGQETKLSPHNSVTGEWEFFSRNIRTGKVIKIDVERFFKYFDKKFRTNFVHEWYDASTLSPVMINKNLSIRGR